MPSAPPPPPPIPSSISPVPEATGDRNALLSSIQKGTKLRKAATNDRSAPIVAAKKTAEPSSNASGTVKATGSGPMGLGGLLAGGMPKLRATGSRLISSSNSASGEELSSSRATTERVQQGEKAKVAERSKPEQTNQTPIKRSLPFINTQTSLPEKMALGRLPGQFQKSSSIPSQSNMTTIRNAPLPVHSQAQQPNHMSKREIPNVNAHLVSAGSPRKEQRLPEIRPDQNLPSLRKPPPPPSSNPPPQEKPPLPTSRPPLPRSRPSILEERMNALKVSEDSPQQSPSPAILRPRPSNQVQQQERMEGEKISFPDESLIPLPSTHSNRVFIYPSGRHKGSYINEPCETPVIRTHTSKSSISSNPDASSTTDSPNSALQLQRLQVELQQAISKQDFERCIELKQQITVVLPSCPYFAKHFIEAARWHQ